MHRIARIGILTFMLFLFPVNRGGADETPVEVTIRQLEKQITAVRGLEFKKPVVAKVISRPAKADPKAQGSYSIGEKTLYLYDDIKGNYQKGVLIHEMVHALQDQHFGLEKLHAESYSSDAELARAALIEGDATYTMIEVLRKEQPRVAAMLDTPLDRAMNLRNAFLYAQGARYVKALKDKGGWKAVDSAYSFPPSSTAAILHPGERISVIDLGPGVVRGELGLIEYLREKPALREHAFEAGEGWRGDRFVKHEHGFHWTILFANPEEARRCREVLAKRDESKRREVRLQGRRVVLIEADDRQTLDALREEIERPVHLTILATRDNKNLTYGAFLDRLAEVDLVCIGETHNSEMHHRVQLQVIKGLFALDDRLGVGMEMFQRPYQPHLDEYQAGRIGEKEMLERTEYLKRWGYDWELYQPIIDFCTRNAIPVAALNAPRELTGRVSQVGYDKLNADEKKQLGEIDFHQKEHRAYWYERLAKMHGQGDAPAERKERSYQVMTVWDEYMADSAARFLKDRRLRRMVVLAGSGHVERGFGIPRRAVKRTGGEAATIKIVYGDMKMSEEPTTDYVLIVK